jgi:hypothetical protein
MRCPFKSLNLFESGKMVKVNSIGMWANALRGLTFPGRA